MANYEDGIFSNLPRLKKRRDDDDRRLSPRQLLAMNFVPEGPLPERPRSSRKGGSSPSGPHAPVISAAPVVTGNAAVGQTLSCSTGTWLYVPTSYAYQWLRNGATIVGATSPTYLTVTADGGTSVSCTVTATNTTGNASATSNALAIAAGGHSAQATAYLARTVGGNEGGNGANIATLIDGLVADGVWAKLDCLYVLAQQNQTDALLNLIGTSYSLTDTSPGALTFTSYKGYNGFNLHSDYYLDTGFSPITAGSPKFVQNDSSFGVWSYAVINEAEAQIGNGNGDAGSSNIFDNAATVFYGRLNGGAGINVATTITKGLFATERTAVATMAIYQNGATSGPQASDTSGSPDNANFIIGNAGPGGLTFATAQLLSAAFIGASLGATLQLALYNRLRTYMTAIGVP